MNRQMRKEEKETAGAAAADGENRNRQSLKIASSLAPLPSEHPRSMLLEATSLSHLLQLSLTKHGRGTTKTKPGTPKKTLLEPNRKSRTKISPSTQTQTSFLYKTSSSLLFGIISLSLSPFVSLCAAEVHSLLVRKSLPKRKKKQNQQQQQQIAANNLLFFLLLFTKRFPEIDQKNQNKIQNRYQTKMKGT
jgi:hypothetical protein